MGIPPLYGEGYTVVANRRGGFMHLIFDCEFFARGIVQAALGLYDGEKLVRIKVWDIQAHNLFPQYQVAQDLGLTIQAAADPSRTPEIEFVRAMEVALRKWPTLIAYGAGADIGQLRQAFLRHGIKMPAFRYLDYFGIVRSELSLPALHQYNVATHLGIDYGTAHNAGDDVRTLAKIITKLGKLPPVEEWRWFWGIDTERHAGKDPQVIINCTVQYERPSCFPAPRDLQIVGCDKTCCFSKTSDLVLTYRFDRMRPEDRKAIKAAVINHYRAGGNFVIDNRDGVFMKRPVQ